MGLDGRATQMRVCPRRFETHLARVMMHLRKGFQAGFEARSINEDPPVVRRTAERTNEGRPCVRCGEGIYGFFRVAAQTGMYPAWGF